jgi:hypothetical protein
MAPRAPTGTQARMCQWSDAGSPRLPIPRSRTARDKCSSTPSRVEVPLMLRSTRPTICPSEISSSWLGRHPMQSLCTLHDRGCRRHTQHSLASGSLRPCSQRSFACWTAPARLHLTHAKCVMIQLRG